MKIDAHNHADWHHHDFDATIANMDAARIDKAWLLSWESPPDEYPWENKAVCPSPLTGCGPQENGPIPFAVGLLYHQKTPGRFVLGYAPDPRRPDAVDRLKSAVHTYGVKVCGEVKLRMHYDNPDAVRLFRYCGEAGLPVTLHIDYPLPDASGRRYPRADWWYGGGIEALERLLNLCPETVFLGHAPGFWCHISDDTLGLTQSYPQGPVIPGGQLERLFDTYSNLYGDCSAGSCRNALTRDLTYARSFITRYHSRLLFARDNYDNTLQELIDSLNLPAWVTDDLYWKNAAKLLGEATQEQREG